MLVPKIVTMPMRQLFRYLNLILECSCQGRCSLMGEQEGKWSEATGRDEGLAREACRCLPVVDKNYITL